VTADKAFSTIPSKSKCPHTTAEPATGVQELSFSGLL
jgi:hypothetical protein